MDKVLLTAFLTALAGFITAVLSIVKLVNEKESKTTEYRQAWTDSLRQSLSELIGNINTLAVLLANNAGHRSAILEILVLPSQESDTVKSAKKFNEDNFTAGLMAERELTRELYQGYARVRLHFKPDDLSFSRFESKFESCIGLLNDLRGSEKDDRQSVKQKIHSEGNELTAISRNILKVEWEAVKLGEPAYRQTKSWSVRFCVVMLFLLITIGVHAVISYWKVH
ncbi:hypothetical protein CCL15_02095 [Pseudomonas syringae]|uniref:hypothetical protein n=1 Tax=Pseudomonas syringae TaxID=317 RepID=UPI000BB6638F|nr:hypothetical protein [Pseudomonas syringae]PBP76164.1 hypothetical protein CCL15_02095 [Pseudomonas syringae]